MEYRIKRGEEQFGPYSLTDLQQYVQLGNISKDDLAQSETMTDWLPVGQILGDIPIPLQPAYAGAGGLAPAGMTAPAFVRLPANLHWGWLLLLDVVTRGYFNIIWAFIQANWACKLSGKNTALVEIAMYPAGVICGAVAIGFGGAANDPALAVVGTVLIIAGLICMLVGVFTIRSAMEQYYNSVENIGLALSGVMTFFFGVIYIQYHINRIARMKKSGEIA